MHLFCVLLHAKHFIAKHFCTRYPLPEAAICVCLCCSQQKIETTTFYLYQGSVLGPLLYLLFTSDLPSTSETTVVAYADDTAILATHSDPSIASLMLQESLNSVQLWLSLIHI